MRILIISKCPTHPTNAGNRWWILSQAEMFMSLGHDVYFLYINEMPLRQDAKVYLESIEQSKKYWGDRYHLFSVSKWQKVKMTLIKYYRKKICNGFYQVDDQYPYGLEYAVNKLDEQIHFDVCVINYYYLSRLFEFIHIPKKAIVTHDCIAYKNLKVGTPTMCITADTEAKAMQRCPHIFALQEVEACYFQLLSPNSEVYNLYGKYEYHPGNHNLLFLSGNNEFNQNGINWFIKDIFPFIKKIFPDAQLMVGGSICKMLSGLSDIDGVKVLGYIDSPANFYAQGDVAINPVYQGTGLKIKTFESISFDKVVMVHPHSMAGIFKKDSAPLFASTDPIEWVEYLGRIWDNVAEINNVKIRNKVYLKEMDEFVIAEYKRFLG